MLNVEYDDFLGGLIDGVIDEVAIFLHHEFSHAFDFLPSAGARKQNQVFQVVIDSGADASRSRWIVRVKVVGKSL